MSQLLWFMIGLSVGSVGFAAALLLVAAGAERREGPAETGRTISLEDWRRAS